MGLLNISSECHIKPPGYISYGVGYYVGNSFLVTFYLSLPVAIKRGQERSNVATQWFASVTEDVTFN